MKITNMLGILIKIIGYAALLLGLLGLVLHFVDIFRFFLSKKSCAFLPWWMFWRH